MELFNSRFQNGNHKQHTIYCVKLSNRLHRYESDKTKLNCLKQWAAMTRHEHTPSTGNFIFVRDSCVRSDNNVRIENNAFDIQQYRNITQWRFKKKSIWKMIFACSRCSMFTAFSSWPNSKSIVQHSGHCPCRQDGEPAAGVCICVCKLP